MADIMSDITILLLAYLPVIAVIITAAILYRMSKD